MLALPEAGPAGPALGNLLKRAAGTRLSEMEHSEFLMMVGWGNVVHHGYWTRGERARCLLMDVHVYQVWNVMLFGGWYHFPLAMYRQGCMLEVLTIRSHDELVDYFLPNVIFGVI
ncbi:hypothetical protein EYC80_001130 [Monilinia laxa]|uniref:Uncharacterized protein n=1 Tax=Monilinia laxa TaxID=61186 RepID=A0A5N6K8E6_MONLA|nr:hypothetical protein EYC80_001130 [Monilinia laxa]